jgi:hypothetical protein
MATHTVIEIPKTMSGAADPHAPSILTTLPAEIRNQIYGHLFKRDGPVLLHDGRACLWELRQKLVSIANDSAGTAEQHIKEEDFRHCLNGCTGILLSCRQVYHEAVGILYGDNTFLFSRALRNQLASACTWLTSIGSHYQLLSRVRIDADDIAYYSPRKFNLLPLLKLLWSHPHTKCDIAFALSGWPLPKGNLFGYTSQPDPIPPMNFMNRVLCTLGTNDALNLKQYAKYSRLISAVSIQNRSIGGSYGRIDFEDFGIPRCFEVPEKFFDISDHGTEAQWRASQQLSLLSLPDEFLSAVNLYVTASDTRIVFDLDTKKAQGYHVGLGGVNQFFRYDIDTVFTRVYDEVVMRMSTREATTDFNSFKALQEMLDVETFMDLINPDECSEQRCSNIMVLMFKLPTPKPTADLRININKLLHMFKGNLRDLVITVQESGTSMGRTKPILWHNLRCAVFLLLSDTLIQCPSEAGQPLPQIWIDGEGTVVCATYPATVGREELNIPCVYRHEGFTINKEQGYRKVKDVVEYFASDPRLGYEFTTRMDTRTLAGFWRHLGETFWEDWKSMMEIFVS